MRTKFSNEPDAGTVDSPDGVPIGWPVDWRSTIAKADRSCCCSAKPAVAAVIPRTVQDGGPVDLLLCGHHYRRSRTALATAGAVVYDASGALIASNAWPA